MAQEYWCKRESGVFGPASIEDCASRLEANDLISNSPEGPWSRLGDNPAYQILTGTYMASDAPKAHTMPDKEDFIRGVENPPPRRKKTNIRVVENPPSRKKTKSRLLKWGGGGFGFIMVVWALLHIPWGGGDNDDSVSDTRDEVIPSAEIAHFYCEACKKDLISIASGKCTHCEAALFYLSLKPHYNKENGYSRIQVQGTISSGDGFYGRLENAEDIPSHWVLSKPKKEVPIRERGWFIVITNIAYAVGGIICILLVAAGIYDGVTDIIAEGVKKGGS